MIQPISPETARHVLWHWGQPGGVQPGSFTQKLMQAIDSADHVNTEMLRTIYPGLVAALKSGGLDAVLQLQNIARGPAAIRCGKCSDTDGPFAEHPNGYLCEGCIKVGAA